MLTGREAHNERGSALNLASGRSALALPDRNRENLNRGSGPAVGKEVCNSVGQWYTWIWPLRDSLRPWLDRKPFDQPRFSGSNTVTAYEPENIPYASPLLITE